MTVTQVWLVAGIPALVLGAAMFIGRDRRRSLAGYLVLAAGFGAVTAVDQASGAVFGGILALLYASGRGGTIEAEDPRVEDTGLPAVVHKRGRSVGAPPS